jgi:Tol biopolymer transport system component
VAPPQITIIDEDGSNPHQIGNLRLDQNNPIVKPQVANGLVVFADMQGAPTETEDNPGPQNGTWAMALDGSGLRQVIQHCTAPSLAPSGTFITCTMETNRHREIWRIDTDGTGLQQLTFPTDPDYPDGNASVISPDETTVAFFSGKESDLGLGGFHQSVFTWGHRDVATISPTGGARHTITACTPVTTPEQLSALPPGACLAADNPSWSPDGRSVVYDRGSANADDGGTWMIDLDGQHDVRVHPDARGAGNVAAKLTER